MNTKLWLTIVRACFFVIVTVLVVFACSQSSRVNLHWDQLTAQFVIIEGVYTLMNVSQIPERPVYNGRVFIVLADGRSIALERGNLGIRPETEIKQFSNTTVKVTGILMPPTVLWGDGSEASIVAEYITAIQYIKIQDTHK